MKIAVKTPRTEMVFASITGKMIDFFDELVAQLEKEIGVTKAAVDEQLSNFAQLSARAVPDEGELDFELAAAGDTPEEIRAKFVKFMATGCYGNVEAAFRRITQLDRPLTPREQQPEPLSKDADPNS